VAKREVSLRRGKRMNADSEGGRGGSLLKGRSGGLPNLGEKNVITTREDAGRAEMLSLRTVRRGGRGWGASLSDQVMCAVYR